jgi:N-acetylneuraminate synthase/sialic acid synthase
MFSNNKIFIIAEVGQNHNGDFDLAKKYIDTFSDIGADAVKFQIRDNKYLFSKETYNKEYNSENAFGPTYGSHREKLELNKNDVAKLADYSRQKKTFFMSTPFDEPSLEFLLSIDVDILKIASFDLGNLPLIDKIGKSKKPVVISIGGGNSNQIDSSIQILKKNKTEFSILHCVSEYPCPHDRLGLVNILNLKKKYPDIVIGLSDHFNGILSGPVAYMLGARVFEKHVTFNRASKGTDHSFALEPDGFKKFVRDIHRTPQMLNEKPKEELGQEPVFKKLGKSLVAKCNIKKGAEFTLENLSGKIFNKQYFPVRRSNEVIGKKAHKDYKTGEIIEFP